jgi:hypothetical protein
MLAREEDTPMLDLTEAKKALAGALPRLAPTEQHALRLVLDALDGAGYPVGDARLQLRRISAVIADVDGRLETHAVALMALAVISGLARPAEMPRRLREQAFHEATALAQAAEKCQAGPECRCRRAERHVRELARGLATDNQPMVS